MLVVLVLVGYMVYYLRPQPLEAPNEVVNAGMMAPKEDSVAAIDSDLKGMSVEGLDSELADINKELR